MLILRLYRNYSKRFFYLSPIALIFIYKLYTQQTSRIHTKQIAQAMSQDVLRKGKVIFSLGPDGLKISSTMVFYHIEWAAAQKAYLINEDVVIFTNPVEYIGMNASAFESQDQAKQVVHQINSWITQSQKELEAKS